MVWSAIVSDRSDLKRESRSKQLEKSKIHVLGWFNPERTCSGAISDLA
jgi:hypothetical protein